MESASILLRILDCGEGLGATGAPLPADKQGVSDDTFLAQWQQELARFWRSEDAASYMPSACQAGRQPDQRSLREDLDPPPGPQVPREPPATRLEELTSLHTAAAPTERPAREGSIPVRVTYLALRSPVVALCACYRLILRIACYAYMALYWWGKGSSEGSTRSFLTPTLTVRSSPQLLPPIGRSRTSQ